MPKSSEFHEEIGRALADHGLDRNADYLPLNGGTANISFVVEGVILTFMPDRDTRQVARLRQLLEHLNRHQFPTNTLRPRLHPPDKGDTPVIAKSFVHGQMLRAVDATTARQIGALLAQLHRVPPPPNLPTEHAMSLAAMARLAERSTDADFSAWVRTALSRICPSTDLPVGLVHGDLFPDNLIRRPDGGLVAIDFEEVCALPLVFDIGMSLAGLAHADSLNEQTWTALCDGYCEQRPLSALERRSIPDQFEHACLITGCWRFESTLRDAPPGAVLRDWRAMQTAYQTSRTWRSSFSQ